MHVTIILKSVAFVRWDGVGETDTYLTWEKSLMVRMGVLELQTLKWALERVISKLSEMPLGCSAISCHFFHMYAASSWFSGHRTWVRFSIELGFGGFLNRSTWLRLLNHDAPGYPAVHFSKSKSSELADFQFNTSCIFLLLGWARLESWAETNEQWQGLPAPPSISSYTPTITGKD